MRFLVAFDCSTGFLYDSAGKETACNEGDLGSIPGLGRSPGEGKGYPFQYSGLENSMDYIVHVVAKSWTRLSDFHFTSLFQRVYALYHIAPAILKYTYARDLSPDFLSS